MSNFNQLRALAALLQPKPVTEATSSKSIESFDGLKSIVEDALADLHDKLGQSGALEKIISKAGLSDLDKNRDDKGNGKTILNKIASLTAEYKKSIESLMTEVEIMLVSANESQAIDLDDVQELTESEDTADAPVEAYGVQGMKSKPWRKKFKNITALNKWIELKDGDAELQGYRELDN